MTVRDLAMLARRIVSDFPEYFKYYGEREYEYAGIKQPNRNPLLQAGVPGVDGMKTGFTDDSGYGLVATAKRDDRRVITVMAGLESARQRRTEGERLLEYGFREFQEYRLFEPGSPSPRPTSGRASPPRCRWSCTETGRHHPLARGAQGSGREARLRQPGARAGRMPARRSAAPRSRPPGWRR